MYYYNLLKTVIVESILDIFFSNLSHPDYFYCQVLPEDQVAEAKNQNPLQQRGLHIERARIQTQQFFSYKGAALTTEPLFCLKQPTE